MKELRKKKRIWLLVLLPLGLILLIFVKHNSFVAEYWFARGIYRVVEEAYCFITGLVPISIAEILLYLSPFLLVYVVYRMVRRLVREKEKRQQNLARYVLNLLCMVSTGFFLFMVLCGANYYRYPFSKSCGLTVETYSIEELYGLCEELTAQANALRAQITSEDAKGVFQLSNI